MPTHFNQGYALIIGVNKQEDPALYDDQLPGVLGDVRALEKVVLDPKYCAYHPKNVEVLHSEDANKDNILDALERLREKVEKDTSEEKTVLIYFSGHGLWSEDRFYLIPYDTIHERLNRTAIEDTIWAEEIELIETKRKMVIMDCCHAGASGVKGSNGKPGNTVIKPKDSKPIKASEGESSDGKPSDSKIRPKDSKPIYFGTRFEELLMGEGKAVLASCKDDEYSYMLDDGSMSVFTTHLIEAITGKALHREDDTVVKALTVMEHLADMVPETAKQKNPPRSQNPTFKYNGENFSIALLRGGEGLPKGQNPPTLEESLGDLAPGSTIVHGNNQQAGRDINNVEGDQNKVGRDQYNAQGDINLSRAGRDIKQAGGDFFEGDKVEGDKIQIGNVEGDIVKGDKHVQNQHIKEIKNIDNSIHNAYHNTGSGTQTNIGSVTGEIVQIEGQNNRATKEVKEVSYFQSRFQKVHQQVDAWTPPDPKNPSLTQEELKEDVEKIEKELAKGKDANESRVERLLGTLKKYAPDVLETVANIIEDPKLALAESVRGLARVFRK